jgi:hypothetical protein
MATKAMRCSDCRRYKTSQCHANPTGEDHESAQRFTCFVPSDFAGTGKDVDARVLGQSEQLVVRVELLPTTPAKPREVPPESASSQSRGCPYCGTILEPPPKRKKACPSCGEVIVVRKGQLVTQAAGERMDLMVRYGIEQQEFLATEEVLAKKFNMAPPPRDVVWVILDERGRASEKKADYQQMTWNYRQRAMFLHEEGRDASHLLEQEARWSLIANQAFGLEKVRILTCNDEYVCDQCRSLAKKVFDISEALKSMPIPPKGCPFCRCMYSGVTTDLDV